MIAVFKRIWDFSGEEQKNIKSSILHGFLYAVFNAIQFGAIYYMLTRYFGDGLVMTDIFVTLLIMICSALGKIASLNKSMVQQTHAGYFMAAHERKKIGEKLKKVPMGFFTNYSLGKITTLTTTKLSQIEIWVPMLLVLVLGGVLNSLIFVASLFFFNQKIGLVAIFGVSLFFLVTVLMERRSRRNASEMERVQTDLTKEILSTVQGMQVIKSYNIDGENNQELTESFEDNYHTLLDLEKMIIPYTIAQRIVISCTIVGMLYLAIAQYFTGDLALPKAMMVMIASFVIFDGLVGAGSSMAILRIAMNAIESLSYMNEIPNMAEGTDERPIKDFEITFENVGFSYDEKEILKNINCKIKEREITAIVGPSGSGKTTFCHLIGRFWDVDEGRITIDHRDVRGFTLANLMDHISYVFQDVYLFKDSIENNIKFGSPNATHEQVVEAAKKAMCHDFIEKLPDGYETIIGEAGATLSGGQKQRLSIARAMLKDAPIIIFDEATANIDPENESKLQEAIESLTENKTIIMIAHRLKTIRNANQILVFDRGRIVQKGNHEELMEEGGLYKDLIDIRLKSRSWRLDNK